MPVVFRQDGFRFHFFSDEGDPREPVHIHIRRGRDNAKFWLWPEVNVAYNRGFSRHTLRQLSLIVESRRSEIERAWNEYFT
jgi:Domain of unknown function (DUF4160)